jgi:hypothetical protein
LDKFKINTAYKKQKQNKMEITIKGYAFVDHVDNTIQNEKHFNLSIIYSSTRHTFLNNLQQYGYIKIMGYLYNAKPYLKKYIVNQYGSWQQYYAPNKTLLRKSIYGRIDKIVQVN